METKRILNLFFTIIITILIIYFLFTLYNGVMLIIFPFPCRGIEDLLLPSVKMLSEGKNIYSPINSPPFIVNPYSPCYILLWTGLVKIFGFSVI